MRLFLKIALSALAVHLPAAAPAVRVSPESRVASQPIDWRDAAREDVNAAYEMFRRHHPGMFGPHDREFAEQLRQALDAALAFVERVEDAEGHMRALALFSTGLGDGHARAQATYSGRGALVWPGFSTVWRGDALHVLDAASGGPPRGSVLLGCDDRAADDLIREEAFWFYGRPEEAGQWWIYAPYLFWRVASPYEALPQSCRFRALDGAERNYRLEWQPVPEATLAARFERARREPIGLSEPRPGIYRIILSSFAPDEQGRAAYERLFGELEAGEDRLAAGRAILLDLRGNGGGNSSWPHDIAERLWGEAAVKAALADYFRETRIWWLADQANIDHFRGFAESLRAEGRANDAGRLAEIAAHLEEARARGERFYIEPFGERLADSAEPAAPRRLPPVYVIVDGGCASACLDGLDIFTRFPGVKLVGAPTSADSHYMDIRFAPLPSGRGGVVVPTKIWVGRPRGSGEVYRPHIPVVDLEWTTDSILDYIEIDLTEGASFEPRTSSNN